MFFGLLIQSRIYSLLHHGPFRKAASTPFSQENPFFRGSDSSILKALQSGFVTQFNEAACSVASVATVLNAMLILLNRKSDVGPITQERILEKVKAGNWAERISREGFRNRRGLPIAELGIVVKSSLEQFDIPYKTFEVVKLAKDLPNIYDLKEELHQRTFQSERIGNCFMIAHFNQGIFIKGLHLPHISPVGAVNTKTKRVLILDVDSYVKEPYWVSFDTFFKGLSWTYAGILRKYGYVGGGYVWICL
jgi:hypothetical protein